MGNMYNELKETFTAGVAIGENTEMSGKDAASEAYRVAIKGSKAAADMSKEKNEKKMAVAKRLKAIREGLGLSQKKVAQETGLNVVTLSGYEVGRAEPNMAALVKLADFYGVSLDYIAGRTNNASVSLGEQTQTDEEAAEGKKEIEELRARLDALEKRYGI